MTRRQCQRARHEAERAPLFDGSRAFHGCWRVVLIIAVPRGDTSACAACRLHCMSPSLSSVGHTEPGSHLPFQTASLLVNEPPQYFVEASTDLNGLQSVTCPPPCSSTHPSQRNSRRTVHDPRLIRANHAAESSAT